MAHNIIVFAGSANPELAAHIAHGLDLPIGLCSIDRFPDGETSVRLEQPVRGREVFIIQPTSPPVNENVMELLAFADACRRASAMNVTAVTPYFGYARSDKRNGRREPITASMVARLMQSVGIDHIVTVDLHTPQIEGFFQIPVDSLSATSTLCDALRDELSPDSVVVSPDVGRVSMTTEFAHRLGLPLVVLHKERQSGTETIVTHIVGDVRDRPCVIVDDMISTGGTLVESIKALLQHGARRDIIVAATHGLLLEGARERLSEAGVRKVVVTNTVAPRIDDWAALKVVSIGPVIVEAIRQMITDGSLANLYDAPT